MDVNFFVWLDVTLRTWRPCHQSLFEILDPSLFETSNKISGLGFIVTMIWFLSSSSWLGLGSWCWVLVFSWVSMWSFEISSPFYQPFKISHLKHKPFELGFNLNFWNVIPSLLTTQNLPQTLNKYLQTSVPNIYKHVLSLLPWYMCLKQISFVFSNSTI
jgi:hypothetical protein